MNYVPEADRLATTRMGITLRGLRKIRQGLQSMFGERYGSMSTADVNREWIEEVTGERRVRLLEMREFVAPEDVVPPDYFVSHAW